MRGLHPLTSPKPTKHWCRILSGPAYSSTHCSSWYWTHVLHLTTHVSPWHWAMYAVGACMLTPSRSHQLALCGVAGNKAILMDMCIIHHMLGMAIPNRKEQRLFSCHDSLAQSRCLCRCLRAKGSWGMFCLEKGNLLPTLLGLLLVGLCCR